MRIKAKDLGKALRKIRGKESMKDFGIKLELSNTRICGMERGDRTPSWNVMERYAKVYGKNIVITFEGTNDA